MFAHSFTVILPSFFLFIYLVFLTNMITSQQIFNLWSISSVILVFFILSSTLTETCIHNLIILTFTPLYLEKSPWIYFTTRINMQYIYNPCVIIWYEHHQRPLTITYWADIKNVCVNENCSFFCGFSCRQQDWHYIYMYILYYNRRPMYLYK